MITIKFDQTLDEEMYEGFSKLIIGGIDFGKKITETHPDITQENYKKYIFDFYTVHRHTLVQSAQELQQAIDASSDEFFDALKEIFKDDFSQNTYIGALSIFDCNPRFVDKKLFQFFYRRDMLGKLEVAYHEILHFAFFKYCERHCSETVKNRSVNGGSYWELSEIVNVIILNQPRFQAILKRPELMFYPSLTRALPQMEKLWQMHSKDIPKFVTEGLQILDNRETEIE